MQSQKRFVAIGLILLSILLFMTVDRGLVWLWEYLGWNDFSIVGRQFTLTTLISFAISVGAGVTCWVNSTISTLLTEVVEEVKKVTWPSREETVAATVVVLITVFIFGAYLGALDALFTWLSGLILDVKSVV